MWWSQPPCDFVSCLLDIWVSVWFYYLSPKNFHFLCDFIGCGCFCTDFRFPCNILLSVSLEIHSRMIFRFLCYFISCLFSLFKVFFYWPCRKWESCWRHWHRQADSTGRSGNQPELACCEWVKSLSSTNLGPNSISTCICVMLRDLMVWHCLSQSRDHHFLLNELYI